MKTDGDHPELVLRSPDRSDSIRLAIIAIQLDVYPSIEVEVEARTRGFGGHAPVWLATDAVAAFAEALNELERTRKGAAQLESMSPGALRLTLSSMDASGHLMLQFTLKRSVLVGDRPRTAHTELSGAFELEPRSLPELVAALRALAIKPRT